jgi:DNA-directed RNA polymerase specialized sigma24 family protein
MDMNEIARELGITRNQVRHALKLGLAKLARNPRMARLYVSQWRAPVSGNVR